jgi:uncharacterized membrane protein YhaH (DUF805 family)
MLAAIKYNLAHVADFTGRQDRPTFWWYFLFLAIIELVLTMALSGSMAAGGMAQAYQAAQSGASQQEIQAQVVRHMSGNMGTMVWLVSAIKAIVAALLVAAFVRRLHDSNNSGWWAALAVVVEIAAIGFVLSKIPELQANAAAMTSGDMTAAAAGRSQLSLIRLLGWVAPVIVLVFGVMKSSPGPNRYGEAWQTA